MPCPCGNDEFKNKVCYECGYDIENGEETMIDGKPYCWRCVEK
jgi:formylmethanofuran dehydrogenase subunit E